MCESSLSLSGSITHPVCLAIPSLSLSLLSHNLTLSLSHITQWVSFHLSPTRSLLPHSHSWLYLCITSPLFLFPFFLFPFPSLNNFRIHFGRSSTALSHSSASPALVHLLQIPLFIYLSLVGGCLAACLTYSRQSDGHGVRPSALHSSATKHNRDQTLQ